ncbi:Endochitinase B1 [Lachnellula cervina]|uniref:chitinase n=1 Tax=Lachnellula cervina TaxID=1316786 RepID=A0A7D8USL6_9HELO|nr:Endochitinase B1 [Lachnellula cervina]
MSANHRPEDIYPRNFNVTDIPVEKFTHIVYCFANISNVTGEVGLSDKWADIERLDPDEDVPTSSNDIYGNLKQLFLLKKRNRYLKTLLSVGGYGQNSNDWSLILPNETLRYSFARTAVGLMYNLGFDGLDYDYEFINSAEQAIQFIDLLNKTRAQMETYSPCPFLLTIDAPCGASSYKFMNLRGMDTFVDQWNIMAYDFAGAFSTSPSGSYAGHAQNLYGSNDIHATPFNTSSAIEYYISQGISPSKINLANPVYGHVFRNTLGPGTLFNGTGAGDYNDTQGNCNYNLLPLAGSNPRIVEDHELGASYSYDNVSMVMVSYDTPNISKQKAQYVQSRDLGGVAWWEVSMDKRGNESLIGAAVDTLGALETSWNRLTYPNSTYDNLRNKFPGE